MSQGPIPEQCLACVDKNNQEDALTLMFREGVYAIPFASSRCTYV